MSIASVSSSHVASKPSKKHDPPRHIVCFFLAHLDMVPFFIYLKRAQQSEPFVSMFIFHLTGVSGQEPVNSRATACRVRSSGNIGP